MSDLLVAEFLSGTKEAISGIADDYVDAAKFGKGLVHDLADFRQIGHVIRRHRYIELCPRRAVSIESIVSPQPRPFPTRSDDFWTAYRDVPAWQFARFLRIAAGGTAPAFADRADDSVRRERRDFEASFGYLKRLVEAASRSQHHMAP